MATAVRALPGDLVAAFSDGGCPTVEQVQGRHQEWTGQMPEVGDVARMLDDLREPRYNLTPSVRSARGSRIWT